MAVIGQMLIQIATETKGLREGMKATEKHISSLQGFIRAARADMRLLTQISAVSGFAQAWSFATQSLAAAAHEAKELRAEAERTGVSVEELSRGVYSTENARDVAAFGAANDRVWSSIQKNAALATLAVNDYVGAVINGRTIESYKAQRTEVEETLAILQKLKIEDADHLKRLDEMLKAEKDKANGVTSEDRFIARAAEAADAEGLEGVTEESIRATLKRHRTMAELREREKRDAEELAKAEEDRKKGIEDMISSARQLALEEGKTARQRAVAEALRNGATVDQAKEIDMWHERAEKIKKDAERLKRREELIKEDTKRKEEVEQALAQQAMDDEREQMERQKRADETIAGRGGVGSIEAGTQAAFSAIAQANSKRQKTDEKQLTTLQKIERNQRKGEKGGSPAVVEQF